MKKLKVRGRPPPKWVQSFVGFNFEDQEFISYKEICELGAVSLNAVHNFCRKLQIEPIYRVENRHAVRYFNAKELQKEMQQYINART